MTLTINHNPTLYDLARLENAGPVASSPQERQFFHLAHKWLISVDGVPVALIAALHLGLGEFEATFRVSSKARPHLLSLIRLVRLTLPKLSYRAVMVITNTGAGARIADLVGFRHHGTSPRGEVWIWDHCSDHHQDRAEAAPLHNASRNHASASSSQN